MFPVKVTSSGPQADVSREDLSFAKADSARTITMRARFVSHLQGEG
jgi:hypothetical protein